MPSFSSSSSIRAASPEHVLRLKITHNLVHGPPSDVVYNVKTRVPKELDVLWLSDIFLSFSGSLDAHEVAAQDIVRSGLALHLHASLKANADRLGLNNVSRPFVDETDGLSKLTLTPSRPLPQPSRPYAHLVSLHLTYIWTSVTGRIDVDSSGPFVDEPGPFSPIIFLPIEALLNRVIEQLLISHFVGRYPLIFGPWCKRLDLEMQYFPSIASSLLEIMARSENRGFRSRCKRLLKAARSQYKFIQQASTAALSSCTNAFESQKEEIDDSSVTPALSDKQVVCENLKQLFRRGIPQRRFKPVATPKLVSFSQEDESLLPSVPDEKADNEIPWVELPETAMSLEVFPEDVDMFAQEDWFADGMWRGHEVDTSPVLAPPESIMCEPQSDESLINTSVSFASVPTRSPHPRSFTLYHHRNVDDHELDPTASGMRNDGSQTVDLEESGSSAVVANPTHSPIWISDDQCFSGAYDQLTEGLLDVSESFEVDSWPERDEDSEPILFEEETGDNVNLDWLLA